MRVFTQLSTRLAALGPANVIYSDGDALFVHAHRCTQSDGQVRAPGLVMLTRQCASDGPLPPMSTLDLGQHGPNQSVVLFASVPLTDEGWTPLMGRQVVVARGGRVVRQLHLD